MSDETTTPPKRRKGGQPGNLNALKHGFYSRQFRKMELADLDLLLETGLESEINMLRVSMRRMLELGTGNTDLERGIRVLTALGETASRLAHLLRTKMVLGLGQKGDGVSQLLEGLEKVGRKLYGED